MGCKARIPGRLTAEEKESGRKKMRQWKENWEKKKSESLTKQIVVRLLKIRKEKIVGLLEQKKARMLKQRRTQMRLKERKKSEEEVKPKMPRLPHRVKLTPFQKEFHKAGKVAGRVWSSEDEDVKPKMPRLTQRVKKPF